MSHAARAGFANVLSFADARRRAGFTTIFDDAQQMVEDHGHGAGLIAGILAKTPETPDDERPYWIAVAEEIERIQGYVWYTTDIGEVRGPERGAPALSTPLTVCLVVLGRHVQQVGFLNVLLGSEPVLEPAESLYQRLLAGDPDEASERAEEYLKTHSILTYFEDVALF